ncbi:hypothetical protein DHEL01_v202764 [Diaporthe helianthi]|uniref:Uncharacterized protein n=1 Tax=Diaporthe helianthi TaxID=158607 RepID=A0A2P5I8M1_DIAHE|nr:hypothetical protein DHEL01_v202764 [Diaporthe helianthi]
MFTTMGLTPIFPDFASHAPSSPYSPSAYRPAISSPLSSSPIRATTPPSPPLSACDANARREIQSSRISASWSSSSGPTKPVSRFASRPARPNPVVSQKREAAQESRRKLFLKNVRQRAEDSRWERRGGEQELLKLEWISLNKGLRQAKNADLDGLVSESDIEEAARLRDEEVAAGAGSSAAAPWGQAGQSNPDVDEMMVDTLEREQQAEIEEYEAIVASMQSGASGGQPWGEQDERKPPDSPHLSEDDDDYDALFMDYLSQEQQGTGQAPASSGEMDLS